MQNCGLMALANNSYLLKTLMSPRPAIEELIFVEMFEAARVFHTCCLIFFTLSVIPTLKFCALGQWKRLELIILTLSYG